MDVLFIHQAFPAQFGRLALELTERHGWTCHFLIEDLSTCPLPSAAMLARLDIHRLQIAGGDRDHRPTPWPQIFGKFLGLCRSVFEAVRERPELRPDLVVGHGGRGAPTVFLPEILNCPIINYCEYYFAKSHSDISYRLDLPEASEVAPFYPRCINAPVLLALNHADAGYSATHWQRQTFPERYHAKIDVCFDGIETELYRPVCRSSRSARQVAGHLIPAGTKVVTFVARGLESVRGFDLFMKVASRIARERADVLFVVAGTDTIYYGWDALHTGQASFKQWAMARVEHDPSRFLFLGHVTPEQLAELYSVSTLHLYLTVPFVLSWSLLNAMSCGCVVLASDVPPVREVIEPGVHGLVEPLFDVDRLTRTALRVLDDPGSFQPMGEAARRLIEETYSLDVCVPALKGYFERVASHAVRDRNPSLPIWKI
jgi:glycosyltransferase involved in cell wall biosynthesis